MTCKLGMSGDRPPEMKGLTETMSELAISGFSQPPPSKIRRRNAITIQDPYPFDLVAQRSSFENNPNAFESSFMLQRMEELRKRLGDLNTYEISDKAPAETQIAPPPSSPVSFTSEQDGLTDFCGPGKRKIPFSRCQITRISLHQDLQAISTKSEMSLPKSILRKYSKKQSNALVLYRPPVNLIKKLLHAEGEENCSSIKEDVDDIDNKDSLEKMFA